MANRASAFGKRLWSDISWATKLPDIVDKWVPKMLLAATVIASSFGFAMPTHAVVRWLSIAALCMSAAYLIWKSAIACHETRGPRIWLSDLRPVSPTQKDGWMFELEVRNRGTGSYIAHVYAIKAESERGERIPTFHDQLEIHWRGLKAEDRMRLYGDKLGIAGVFQTDMFGDGDMMSAMPSLVAICGEPRDIRLVHLLEHPIPRFQQKEGLRLTIRVDFIDDDGECAATKEKRFAIIPAHGTPMQYRTKAI